MSHSFSVGYSHAITILSLVVLLTICPIGYAVPPQTCTCLGPGDCICSPGTCYCQKCSAFLTPNPDYYWVKSPSGKTFGLCIGTKQVGSYDIASKTYYPLDGDKWGATCDLPNGLDVPTKSTLPRSATASAVGTPTQPYPPPWIDQSFQSGQSWGCPNGNCSGTPSRGFFWRR